MCKLKSSRLETLTPEEAGKAYAAAWRSYSVACSFDSAHCAAFRAVESVNDEDPAPKFYAARLIAEAARSTFIDELGIVRKDMREQAEERAKVFVDALIAEEECADAATSQEPAEEIPTAEEPSQTETIPSNEETQSAKEPSLDEVILSDDDLPPAVKAALVKEIASREERSAVEELPSTEGIDAI